MSCLTSKPSLRAIAKRHSGSVRHSDGRGGRRRDGDDYRSVNRGGFLHHLNRYAAGVNNNPLLRCGILADEGARELAQPPSLWLGALPAPGNRAIAATCRQAAHTESFA
jgi:hypothetical protein